MKNYFYLLIFSIIIIALVGCSKNSYSPAYGGFESSNTTGYSFSANNSPYGGVYQEKSERKVLFDAYLSMIVDIPDTANVHVQNVAKKYEGYVSQLGTYRSVIRVKSDKLDLAISEIEELGKVESKSITGQDVTDEYLDYEIRLENAEKARLRYLELLEKAEDVKSALLVEKELERLNGTIDALTGKMNRIDHLAEYSTITITLKERKKPGVLGYIGLGLYHSVKWLFVRN